MVVKGDTKRKSLHTGLDEKILSQLFQKLWFFSTKVRAKICSNYCSLINWLTLRRDIKLEAWPFLELLN